MGSWPPVDGRRPDPEFADIDRAADALFRKLDPAPFSDEFRAYWHGETGVDPGLGTPTEVEPGYPHSDMLDIRNAFEAGRRGQHG